MTRPKVEKVEIVPSVPVSEGRRIEQPDDRPALGSWWWVNSSKRAQRAGREEWTEDDDSSDEEAYDGNGEYDEPGKKWIASVTRVGSNFALVEGYNYKSRIALDHFHKRCTPEPNPGAYIRHKVGFHQNRVQKLMGEVQALCRRLGVPIHQVIGSGDADATDPVTSGQALAVVHGVADVKKYETALVKAKEKTLPELLEKVEAEHEQMARWMRVEMIPAKAELMRAKGITDVLDAKIQTVELYAGLTEELVEVRRGKPATIDDKVHLMQRRHYMDEECLANYEAGGMSYENIGGFDKWLSRDENFRRLFPHPRTFVAFRIRRHDRRSEDDSIATFIKLLFENRQNKRTFLYIRNGEQLWRLETAIDFDDELFPHKDDNDLLSDTELWINPNRSSMLRTGNEIRGIREEHQAKRDYMARKLWQWHRAGCPGDDAPPWMYTAASGRLFEQEPTGWRNGFWSSSPKKMEMQQAARATWKDPKKLSPGDSYPIEGEPSRDIGSDDTHGYVPLTPDSLHYDDAMAKIREVANEHNRIAIIVQGLLDRSTCLHPHPPWRIWTQEGFRAAIELVYDVSRALTSGEKVRWQEYRAQLNKSIRPGCYTIGQYRAWLAWMTERFGSKWKEYAPGGWGNKGPSIIAKVHRVLRNGDCEFQWTRDRVRPVVKWVPATRPGYVRKEHSYPEIPVKWVCPREHLTCVSAYTPGDYHLFYDDPRTREEYIRWAPILLSAENWHAKRRQAEDEAAKEAAKAARKKPTHKSKVAARKDGLAARAAAKRGKSDATSVGIAGFAEAVEAALEGDAGFSDDTGEDE